MWATCASQVSRFLLSLKTIQYGVPFRSHGTSTVDQMVRVDRGSLHDCEVELSPYQDSTIGAQTLSTTEGLLHHEVVIVHDKMSPTLSNATGKRQESVHQRTGSWFTIFFGTPPLRRHVEVDVDAASRWVEGEDRGPGMQESQVGRYDAWL